MARYWMHNGFLQVEGEKMSKSLGNFVTIHDLLHTEKFGGRKWPGEALRLAMLRTHYRQPIDWTVKALEEAEAGLRRWAEFIEAGEAKGDSGESLDQVVEALADDLNTPLAISVIRNINDPGQLDAALKLLGVDVRVYAQWLDDEKRKGVDGRRAQGQQGRHDDMGGEAVSPDRDLCKADPSRPVSRATLPARGREGFED
jgi:cysteinyl-tRNA synthetase